MATPLHDPDPLPPLAGATKTVSRVAVPNITFDNRSAYDALQFDIVDTHGAAFHIFVAKIGYQIGSCGADGLAPLLELEVPARLHAEDLHADGNPAASVLEEGDFAPFKPRCDLIVNAMAHAPRGIAVQAFPVRLRLDRPGQSARTGIADVAPADREALIDKTLIVNGERCFKRKAALTRWLQWPVVLLTLGLLRPTAWRLSRSQRLTKLPLRYEYAGGGECRIDSTDAAAKRVPARDRLQDIGGASNKSAPAVAHEASQRNPIGRGFARGWYLRATRRKVLAAPQISYAAMPISVSQFHRCAEGGALAEPAGLGPVGRAWLPRRALIGHIEDKSEWDPEDVPSLPVDFDYGYWNCAPTDQQCPYLHGAERVALSNLCGKDNPAARTDKHGNTVLSFELPRQAMFVLAVNNSNQLTVVPLVIDTVIISPETRRVDLVWRACIEAEPDLVASRLIHVSEQAQLERLALLVHHQWSEQPPASPGTPTAKPGK